MQEQDNCADEALLSEEGAPASTRIAARCSVSHGVPRRGWLGGRGAGWRVPVQAAVLVRGLARMFRALFPPAVRPGGSHARPCAVRSDPSAPSGGRKRSPFLLPAGAPGLAATLDFVSGPDDQACLAQGLRPLLGPQAHSLVVRFRGVGNNAVKGAFKAAGFRREPAAAAAPAFALHPDQPPVAPWAALWGGQLSVAEYARVAAWQRVNHFPSANELGRKDKLARTLQAAALHAPSPHAFAFAPRTFCLPADAADWAVEAANHFAANAAEDAALARSDSGSEDASGASAALPLCRLYMTKPPALSRGRGVKVMLASNIPRHRRLLVQRYIHPPHLIDGLKYDLRLYALVTSVSPLRAYLHTSGLVRFATAPYDPDSTLGAAHVTNVSVRSKAGDTAAAAAYVPNTDAGQDDIGHKWSLAALRRRLERNGLAWEPLWARISDVVARTLIAANARMAPALAASGSPVGSSFELYGFDVLLDGDLKPWLLEVNTGPNLAAPTPLDTHVKCRVAAEMLHLAGISPVPAEPVSDAAMAAAAAEDESRVAAGDARAPLALQPLCVRQLVAEEGRMGSFHRVFPSPEPQRNAQLLPLFSPPCPRARAMCDYLAAQ